MIVARFYYYSLLFCASLLNLHFAAFNVRTMWTETQRAARSRFKSQFLSFRFSPILSFSFGLNLCLSPNYPCAESSEILHLVYSK